MVASLDDMLAAARAWLADDPDPTTRAALSALIEARDTDGLEERFAAPLQFGTAGLRGVLGAGPGRMNHLTVARVSAGLAAQLLADVPDAKRRGVAVGRDGRKNSDVFAKLTAEILAGHGITVHWVPGPNPTPVVAFAGLHLDAAGTVIVTASHNPPEYNGYKVYAPVGRQIVPPQDGRIRECREAVGPFAAIPRVDFTQAVAKGLIKHVPASVYAAYLDSLDETCLGPVPPPVQVRVVTTALHGVGHRWISDALVRRGHRYIFPVLAQAAPDGAFPTVRFPNPEEDGALDLALELAAKVDADLILANDPDTDRLAIAVRSKRSPTGYQPLSGNAVGILLADWVLTEGARLDRLPEKPLVVTSIVSTMMLERLAQARGAHYGEGLTGFKWIWEYALQRVPHGETYVFGFEEALGYCVGRTVRDKDGIGAAQIAMELVASLQARGQTLLDRLDELAKELGVYLTDQVAVTLPGLEGKDRIGRIMGKLRDAPPAALAGSDITRRQDLSGPDADSAGLPRGNVLVYRLADGGRVIVRPSGTEPKIKCYLEARQDVAAGETVDAARARARTRLDELAVWVRAFIDETD